MKVKLKKAKGLQYHKPTIPLFDTKFRPDVVAIDTETTGLGWSKNDILYAISAAWYDVNNELFTAYWDFPVNPYSRIPDYQGCKGLNLLRSYYTDPKIRIVMANSKFDRHMLSKRPVNLERWNIKQQYGAICDVLIAAWCCNTMESSYSLNNLSEKYIDVSQNDAKDLKAQTHIARSKAKKLGLNAGAGITAPPQDYWLLKYFDHNSRLCEIYAIKDAGERTLNLWYYYEQAMEHLGVREAFDIETQLSTVLYRMEKRGVRFFDDTCVEELEILRDKIDKAKQPIIQRFGDINVDSSKQLAPCIYDIPNAHSATLGLPVIERTEKSREPSTSAPTFNKLLKRDTSGILQALLERQGYTTGSKSCKNYLKAQVPDKQITLQDMPFIHQRKCIHANFNQISSQYDKDNKTRTGRLSSSDPNLQNVIDPQKRDNNEYMTNARAFFGPREGFVWYCIDYSQLELRVFAERLGSSSALYKGFIAGDDPHNVTRLGIPHLAKMEYDAGRKIAKNFNFGVINSAGIKVFHTKYNIPLQEAKEGLEGFYDLYPETKLRQKEAEKYAIKHGHIKTLFNRKINVDCSRYSAKEAHEVGKSYLTGKYKHAYRASAYDIQGSAADIIKRGMIAVDEFINSFPPSKLNAHLLLSVHDELIFEVWHKNTFKWFLNSIKLIMESIAKDVMKIPLEVEIKKTTKTWSSKDLVGVVI